MNSDTSNKLKQRKLWESDVVSVQIKFYMSHLLNKSFKILQHSTSTFQKYVSKQDFMILL